MSFRTWLRQHRHANTAIGDLARDVTADTDWPRGPGSLARYRQHLEDRGACDGALTALAEAWAMYEPHRTTSR